MFWAAHVSFGFCLPLPFHFKVLSGHTPKAMDLYHLQRLRLDIAPPCSSISLTRRIVHGTLGVLTTMDAQVVHASQDGCNVQEDHGALPGPVRLIPKRRFAQNHFEHT